MFSNLCEKRFNTIVALSVLNLIWFAPSAQARPSNSGDSPVQGTARPFGLNIVNKVQRFDADTASQNFRQNSLPDIWHTAITNLPEGKPLSNKTVGLHAIDPAKIFLKTAADVRCYFVGEGAGYHNTLGFNASGGGITSGDPKLIFPDASSSVPYSNTLATNGVRTSSNPLLPGDFVDMGRFQNNTQLNFFNISNGANGGKDVFSTQHSLNRDGLVHAVAYTVPNSPYLLIGFEDLNGGGDRDYNDVMFTLNIGTANVNALSSPEPSTGLILLGFLAITATSLKAPVTGSLCKVFSRQSSAA